MNYLVVFRTAWVVALIVVLWKSCIPDPGEYIKLVNDKLAHFLVFLFLGTTGFVVWSGTYQKIQIFSFLAIYGAVIEGVQYFVDNRSMSFADWIMDLLGLIGAILVIKLVDLQYQA